MGFWLSHVPRERLADFLALTHRWLKPGGRMAAIDSFARQRLPSAADHAEPVDDVAIRRLADGREFRIVKVYYTPDDLAGALGAAGFDEIEVTTTGRFFVMVSARSA